MKLKAAARILITLAVVLSIYVLVKNGVGIKPADLMAAFSRFSWSVLSITLLIALLQVTAQVFRFTSLFPPRDLIPESPRFPSIVRAACVGHFLNNFTPLRTGDAYKALALAKSDRLDREGLSLGSMAGIVLAERVSDNGTLILIVAIAESYLLQEYLQNRAGLQVGVAATALALVAALVFLLKRKPRLNQRFYRLWHNVLEAMVSRRFLVSCGFAVAAWCLEFWCFQVLCRDVGVELSYAQCIAALFAMNLGLALPLTFANLGVMEAALALGLARFDVDPATGLAIAIVYHAVQLSSILIGAIAGLLIGATGRDHAAKN